MQGTYAQANVSPLDAGYVEAHGTGTKVGDPIESRAIYHVFGSGRTKRNPIYVGSVKTNVGHLENVSGIISIIKATLMLEKGFILPNINFEKANETIPLDQWNMKVSCLLPKTRSLRQLDADSFVNLGPYQSKAMAARKAVYQYQQLRVLWVERSLHSRAPTSQSQRSTTRESTII